MEHIQMGNLKGLPVLVRIKVGLDQGSIEQPQQDEDYPNSKTVGPFRAKLDT